MSLAEHSMCKASNGRGYGPEVRPADQAVLFDVADQNQQGVLDSAAALAADGEEQVPSASATSVWNHRVTGRPSPA